MGLFSTGVTGAFFDVREGEQIHGYGVKIGLLVRFSVHLTNAIMTMYPGCVSKVDVVKVFDEITERENGIVSCNERIGAAYDGVECLELFTVLCLKFF